MLKDHSAMRALGHDFPIAVPNPGGRLPGVAVSGLTADGLSRVRFFEDTDYTLEPVTVETASGPVAAAYFASASLIASPDPWSLEEWQATKKPLMLAVTAGLMAAYGTIAPGDVDALWHRLYKRLAPLYAPDQTPDAL
jgi:hypothetical protein